MIQTQYIPAIHEYCDHWCKRCPFTAFCSEFSTQEESNGNWIESNLTLLQKEISSSVEQTLNQIQKEAEFNDIDLVMLLEIAKGMQQQSLLNERDNELIELVKFYQESTTLFLEKHNEKFNKNIEKLLHHAFIGINDSNQIALKIDDALDSIHWDLTLIEAKIKQAIHHIDIEKSSSIQNEANGYAKIALLSIKRSIEAWETIRTEIPDLTDELIEIFLILDHLKLKIKEIFPNALQFVRPGFDTLKDITII